ncbi:hypothetical protein L2E82_25986 [Cichorium intybus]|uniref:Uncharacterized protein n=1 Tax=Cichorium intybus TaxID=13427 RepID=A0ACB9E5B8_CICIN|nr:hypothetical protein L2E82_25986 [Cichorium intybus]
MSTRIKQLDGASVDVKKRMDTNNVSNLEVPTRVPGWLEEVKDIKGKTQNISSTGCFNIKMRYRAGKNACKITEDIESLVKENLEMIWSDTKKPIGKVNTKITSSSARTDGDAQNHFKSREESFKKAFESLQQDHTSKVFNNLRVLDVFKCENLRYLFTVPVASGLVKLEHLTVSQCPVLDVLAHSENGGDEVIKFQKLKFLSLNNLPKLVGLCNTVNTIELPELVELRLIDLPHFTSIYPENPYATPAVSSNKSAIQPFFNKEVLIPKLEILQTRD